jgi:hypothetical protein
MKCPKKCKCTNACKCKKKNNNNLRYRRKTKTKRNKQNGGNFYKPAPPIPGPFIGEPIGETPSTWPGENGIGGDRNYYTENKYNVDPQTMMKLGGKCKKRTRRKKGGGAFSQGLVNIGRSIGYNLGSSSNQIRGYDAPINPLPWKDQLTLNKSIY